MANSWFRLYHEFATDPKIQMLSEALQRRYIMILCIHCSNNDVTLHDDEVAFQLRVTPEDYAETKIVLISKGLINEDNKPVNWDKRQFKSDSSARRVSEHRKKKKQACNVTETKCNALDTDTDTDTDTDKQNITSSFDDSRSDDKNKKIPYSEIFDAYNAILGDVLPAVRERTTTRRSAIKSRVNENREKRLSVDWWKKYFSHVRQSNFLIGVSSSDQPSQRVFTASFDWLLNPTNMAKVIEGNYHER